MYYVRCLLIFIASFLLCVATGLYLHADQVIYVGIANFDPALSQFGIDVKGNTWEEEEQDGALNGTAFGAPGDDNRDYNPYLAIKFPEKVKQGESTADGKEWAAWARLYEPALLQLTNQRNSFFFRMSADAQNWTPENRGDSSLLWNDPGGQSAAKFPDFVDDINVVSTDADPQLPWFWQIHKDTRPGWRVPESTIDPVLAVGDNYVELGIRESHVTEYPRIDAICFRNDSKLPSDAEALEYFEAIQPVQPAGKLVDTWGEIKSAY